MKKKSLPVLMYHGISDQYSSNFHRTIINSKQFYQQMILVKSLGFVTVSIHDAWGYLDSQKKSVNPIVISFDDGYYSTFKIAFPIMQKLGLVGTLFLSVKTIGQQQMTSSEHLDKNDRPLNWDEILFLQKNGWSIQSHGVSHQNYNLLSINDLRSELKMSKEIIEEKMNRPVDYFAYPFGKYSERLINTLRPFYKAAFTTHQGLWMPSSSIYQIPRIEINNNTNQQIFTRKLIIGYSSQREMLAGHIKNKIFKNIKLYDRLRGL